MVEKKPKTVISIRFFQLDIDAFLHQRERGKDKRIRRRSEERRVSDGLGPSLGLFSDFSECNLLFHSENQNRAVTVGVWYLLQQNKEIWDGPTCKKPQLFH